MFKLTNRKNKEYGLSNKAFTLIELLAVIIILAIVALIATPIILDVVDDARKSAGLSEANMILSGINNYCLSEEMKYQLDNSYEKICTSNMDIEDVATMVNLGNAKILDVVYLNDELIWLKVESNGNIYSLEEDKMVRKDIEKPSIDYSGANEPKLLSNMIPVVYDGTNWKYTSTKQTKWYNYEQKEWANAVVLNEGVSKQEGDIITEEEIALWYVWIPRYKYQLFNVNNGSVEEQEIQITFEDGTSSTGTVECTDIDFTVNPTSEVSETCTNAELGNWYTHPAFTFGEQELTGFWVGKFEVSGTTDKITIKPNVSSLRNQTTSSFFTSIQNISNVYSINGDSHMIKNMEWGAVAYLTQSQYGRCTDGTCTDIGLNNNSNYITGCGATSGSTASTECNSYNTETGMNASTTGNIYGIYDMSGGAWEKSMGTMVNSNGEFYSSDSGFITVPDKKYYDSYTYSTSSSTHGRGKLGDATKETLKIFGSENGGWYNNRSIFCNSKYSWFALGGTTNSTTNAGLFSISGGGGNPYNYTSSRAIISISQ